MRIKSLIHRGWERLVAFLLYSLFAVLFYQLFIAPNGIRLLRQLSALESQQQEKLYAIESEINLLQQKHQWLQSDELYLEFEAREEWGYMRPGERVLQL